jgi:hypothetical protein
MKTLSKNYLFATIVLGLTVILWMVSAVSRAGVLYFNGFETNDPGAADFYDTPTGTQPATDMSIVQSGQGQLKLNAASGGHYAEINNVDNAYSTATGIAAGYGESVGTDYGFVRNGGTFDPISGNPNGPGVATNGQAFYESAAYYINMNWTAPAATYAPAFWIDTTPYNDPNFLDECNFRISVPGGAQPITVGGFVGNPGTNGTVATITASGWYTFKTTFEDHAGVVKNVMSIADSNGNTIGSFSGDSTLPFSDLAGTNYGDWTTVWQNGFGATSGPNENGAADVLGIDDIQVGTVPEPASLSLVALGIPLLLRRRRA